jgi:hypothetical protein
VANNSSQAANNPSQAANNSSQAGSDPSTSSTLASLQKGVHMVGDFKIKDGMTFEGLTAQLQPFTSLLLCIKDGDAIYSFPEYGPFPPGLQFEHKQKRFGLTEYYFRTSVDDSLFCVFGRENAEVFCSGYVDDEDTLSDFSDSEGEGEPSTEVYSTSEESENAEAEVSLNAEAEVSLNAEADSCLKVGQMFQTEDASAPQEEPEDVDEIKSEPDVRILKLDPVKEDASLTTTTHSL